MGNAIASIQSDYRNITLWQLEVDPSFIDDKAVTNIAIVIKFAL